MMRIVVVGTSGAGKTTLARGLAAKLGIAHVEIDAINWQPGWRELNADDPPELVRRVDAATSGADWICDGNYSALAALVWDRATHLIWLDYPRHVVMRRVVLRSLQRALDRRELWPGTGNRETWGKWLHASHPIRWAWSTWQRRRLQTETLLNLDRFRHLKVLRLTHPSEARGVADWLAQ